jgi:predicted dehydrogenase
MRAQASHFIECVRNGRPVRSPASEAVKDLEVAEQYVRALQQSLQG